MIKVGVIGYGYWGPNIVRNLHGLDSTRAEMICDKSPSALARARKAYPSIRVFRILLRFFVRRTSTR